MDLMSNRNRFWKYDVDDIAFFCVIETTIHDMGASVNLDSREFQKQLITIALEFFPLTARKHFLSLNDFHDSKVLRDYTSFKDTASTWYHTYAKQLHIEKLSVEVSDPRLRTSFSGSSNYQVNKRIYPDTNKKHVNFVETSNHNVEEPADSDEDSVIYDDADDATGASLAEEQLITANAYRVDSVPSPSAKFPCISCLQTDHSFMEIRGDPSHRKYQILCKKRVASRTDFEQMKDQEFQRLFGVPRPKPQPVRVNFTTTGIARPDMLEQIAAETADDQYAFAHAILENITANNSNGPIHTHTYSVTAKVLQNIVQTGVNTSYIADVNTHVKLPSVLHDSGAEISLCGAEFAQHLIDRGYLQSLSQFVNGLTTIPYVINVEGINGNSTPVTSFFQCSFAICAPNSSAPVIIRDVPMFYCDHFPTLIGEDALTAAGLMPWQQIERLSGLDVTVRNKFLEAQQPKVTFSS